MPHSPPSCDRPATSGRTRSAEDDVRVLGLLPLIGHADSTETVVSMFREAVSGLGADAGVFISYLRDDATRNSLRSLWPCDPAWAAEYAYQGLFSHDPWLRYATHESEPILASAIKSVSVEEEGFVATAASCGLASVLIAPAPSGVGTSRVGMLCLGSQQTHHFENAADTRVPVLARALAMELHHWLQQNMRKELLIKSRITEADLDLLRQEAAGLSSKVIGAALNLEPSTIDCRFQRLNAKLDAPDRRTALRIARLYGLI